MSENEPHTELPEAIRENAEEEAALSDEPDPTARADRPDPARPRQTDRLGTDPIGKLLFEFSLPSIISMVFNMMYNVVDTAMLGWFVGEVGVAVTTLALPVMTILMGASMLAGVGGNALAAIQLGQGELRLVERTLGNSAVLLFAISLLVAVGAFVFIDPLLVLIGTTAELWEPTKTFIQIICAFSAFQSLGMGLNNFLRTAGRPTMALATMMLGTAMCVVFNVLFVGVLGWGIAGSAWATVLGQLCGMVPIVWYFSCSRKAPFHLRPAGMAPNLRLMGRICALGMASFAMQAAATVVNIVFNQVVTAYGALDPLGTSGALAAIGVAQKVCSFVFAFMVGLTMGMQPIIGFNYGAKKWGRVYKTLKWACIWGVIFGAVYLALTHAIPRPLVNLFGISGDLESFSVFCLQIYTIFYPLVGYQIVGGSYFQSTGQPLKAAIIELLRQVIFLIPLYLILPHLAGFFGLSPLMMVVIAVPLSDILSVIVTTVLLAKEVRKLKTLEAAKAA